MITARGVIVCVYSESASIRPGSQRRYYRLNNNTEYNYIINQYAISPSSHMLKPGAPLHPDSGIYRCSHAHLECGI